MQPVPRRGGSRRRVSIGWRTVRFRRDRDVPLGEEFVQVDAQPIAAGGCAPPDVLPPSGSTERYRLVDSWVLVEGGEAQWVLTGCA